MPPPQVLAIISQKKKPNFANEKRPTLLAHELTEKPYFKIYHKKTIWLASQWFWLALNFC